MNDLLGLANRGLGNLEMAQDEKSDQAVRTQALDEGNQFYAGRKRALHWGFSSLIADYLSFSNGKRERKRHQHVSDHHQR